MNSGVAPQAVARSSEEGAARHAEEIVALQRQLAEEQSAKEAERRVREQAEQQIAELKVRSLRLCSGQRRGLLVLTVPGTNPYAPVSTNLAGVRNYALHPTASRGKG